MDDPRDWPRDRIMPSRAVAIGGSAGGFEALMHMLPLLPAALQAAVLVVQHLHPSDRGAFAEHLARFCTLQVFEAWDKQKIEAGCLYVAPANYHMLIERDGRIALSLEERVNWSRPSIDVLLESAAKAWGQGLIAIILTGANCDGAQGIKAAKAAGGVTIAQNPDEASNRVMPQAAIETGAVDRVMSLADIGACIPKLIDSHEPLAALLNFRGRTPK